MKQILKENDSISAIIGKAKASGGDLRFSHYAVAENVDDGVLLFHTLTRELLLLTAEEYREALTNPTLREKWFVVPENTQEKQLTNMVRWVLKMKANGKPGLSNFIVYTTTDCNARCFYCFELGRKRVPMSPEMAHKTADFIIKNNNGSPITINWFGGEPLFNAQAMDIICLRLREEGISYATRTITNGYLMNEENVRKCVELWNLKRVQISMDGTEAVYNKAKRYIYKEGNPYQIVMENIQRMLDSGIMVLVRLNMDFHNLEDLNLFADELAARFGGNKKFFVYPFLIIDEKKQWDEYRSPEQWTALYAAKAALEDKLTQLGIFALRSPRLERNIMYSPCMAENSNSIVITPEGNLGVCEHYSETELIGHMDSPDRDQAVIESFRVNRDDVPECDTCFHYPECMRLKKCPYFIPCMDAERTAQRRAVSAAMRNEYKRWLNKNAEAEELITAEELI